MGWKGTVRSIGAAVRAAERDAKRRQRELERQQIQFEKMQELEQAAYEVEVYENHIDVIQSTHKECSPPIDWNKIASSKQPTEPKRGNENESKARQSLKSYKPGIIDRLLKREEKKRSLLSQKVDEAIKKDEINYKSSVSKWEKDTTEWKESVAIAKALLDGKAEAKIEAIENLQPFTEISNLGSSLSISVYDNGILEATINVHGTEIVPSETKSLLKSGKLSVKNMPKGKFNEIYQDYVCSCVLRVGNELFSAIPDNLVIVTAVDELLNSQTGHLEDAPILSVAVSRSTIERLNLEAIDPSDSMDNFKHNMSFKKTKGFERVERIDPEGLDCA
ncbi:hypothetical protein [Shewanella algae]|uniref:Uncharacterized protein n=2 Tax=Shewanella algae TaxID=38313 RepID=A0A380BEC4_9GAMM|nr:hypothetical protein [Shewanella algae]MBO2557598.1 hypothetical protein [Shewanella algae]MBO2574534.1 hypothetical protein [Shewanella algae]MBO2608559.1 hypothetical protein [Shewanella algae]QTE83592.1 hypothetical protein JKK46_06780 [Shewanella algae]SUJ00118.1 Uncharacterised protein [Shewanella algae]